MTQRRHKPERVVKRSWQHCSVCGARRDVWENGQGYTNWYLRREVTPYCPRAPKQEQFGRVLTEVGEERYVSA